VREVGKRRVRFGGAVWRLFGRRSRSLVLRGVTCLRLGFKGLWVRCGGCEARGRCDESESASANDAPAAFGTPQR
jgi:hypothetical protein